METPNQPHYSEALLRRLIWQTKDIHDLVDLCRLYRELEEQGDIIITFRLNCEIKIQQQTLIYRDGENKENLNQ